MNNQNYYVYHWIRLDTGEPFYVGKGGTNKEWKRIHYGNKSFLDIYNNYKTKSEIIIDGLEELDAYDLEIEYIRKYKQLGYNLINKAVGGWGNKGAKWKLTTEQLKNKTTLYKSGEENPRYGKPSTFKDKKHTEETKQLLSEIAKEQFKNNGHPRYGIKTNINSITKMQEKMGIKVKCLNTEIIYLSINEASRQTNTDPSSIKLCCEGRYRTAGKDIDGNKLRWCFV